MVKPNTKSGIEANTNKGYEGRRRWHQKDSKIN